MPAPYKDFNQAYAEACERSERASAAVRARHAVDPFDDVDAIRMAYRAELRWLEAVSDLDADIPASDDLAPWWHRCGIDWAS